MRYHANFALFIPYASPLPGAVSGKRAKGWRQSCGVLARNHEPAVVRLMLFSAPSKSSTYDTPPSLAPVRDIPGMKCANSACNVNVDGAFVLMPGSRSIILVIHDTSWL